MTVILSGWTVSLFELGSLLFVGAPQGRAVDMRWEPAQAGAPLFERRRRDLWAGPLAIHW